MTLLLDTHALIWALSSPSQLPTKIRELLTDTKVTIFASVISVWEIAIKKQLKRIDFPLHEIGSALDAASFIELPLMIKHSLTYEQLPLHHKDPFDRMLVAQAINEQFTIISKDRLLRKYDVEVLW